MDLGRLLTLIGIAGLILCLMLGLAAGDAVAKKKKKKGGASVFAATQNPNLPIPDAPPAGTSILVSSTITVGGKFKGKQVGDVNITGIRTTGSTGGAVSDLRFALMSPTGRTMAFWEQGPGGAAATGIASMGPLTLDDDTFISICDSATPTCSDPTRQLLRPFAGTANLKFTGVGGTGPLNTFDRGPMQGTWTFFAWDSGVTRTSILNSWGLQITAKRPVT
jgi:hypothetical protein